MAGAAGVAVATSRATVDSILVRLRSTRFTAKAAFGEYVLYADGKAVALVCDDRLFVKVHEVTAPLQSSELVPPYPGAKPHYLVEEAALSDPGFPAMLVQLGEALPARKPKPKARAKTNARKK